jgi:hypothetical protein
MVKKPVRTGTSSGTRTGGAPKNPTDYPRPSPPKEKK